MPDDDRRAESRIAALQEQYRDPDAEGTRPLEEYLWMFPDEDRIPR